VGAPPFVLTLTQAWIPPGEYRYAFNGLSWSLACEAFFYLLFPSLISPISKIRRLPMVMGGACGVMTVAETVGVLVLPERALGYLFYTNPAFRLGEFITGICLALLLQRGWRPRFAMRHALLGTAGLYVLLMGGTLLTLGAAEDLPYVVANLWLMPGFVAIIAAGAAGDLRGDGGHFRTKSLVKLGQWSFALYLVHELVIRASVHLINPLPFPQVVVACLLVFCVSVALSGLLYEAYERPVEKKLRPVFAVRQQKAPLLSASQHPRKTTVRRS
jgi:peptidoglycan/LPS O-acetylase OafA/YrhL